MTHADTSAPTCRPLISVVVPTYNRGPQIASTLDSVFAQVLTAAEWELIVVDDGSTDDTGEFLRRTYTDNARVRLVTQANAGVAQARNRGLSEARGDFIAFLDHDDHWLPGKLEAQWQLFQHRPEIGVVYCAWREVDLQGQLIPPEQQARPLCGWSPARGEVYDWLMTPTLNRIVSMSVPMMRTDLVREVGGFDPHMVPCDDWDLWLRLSRRCQWDFTPRELVLYTRYDAQQSANAALMWQATRRVLFKQVKELRQNARPKNRASTATLTTSISSIVPILRMANEAEVNELYCEAKSALFAARLRHVGRLISWMIARHPLAFCSRRWLYLAARWAARNTQTY